LFSFFDKKFKQKQILALFDLSAFNQTRATPNANLLVCVLSYVLTNQKIARFGIKRSFRKRSINQVDDATNFSHLKSKIMKHRILAFLAMAFFLSTALQCKKNSEDPSITLMDEAEIGWQDCVIFSGHENLRVCFTSANEYRCPCYADCFWEGAIDATLKVTGPGIDDTLILTTNSNPIDLNFSDTLGNKIITFVNTNIVDCDDYGKLEKYKVKIKVTEL
jgi:hypothetical protein